MKSKILPKISETEWEVMRVVWARHPVTASEIIDELSKGDASWHPKPTRTLLGRLVKKKALDYEARGRSYVYEPRVTERECVASASSSFLDRVFGGALRPLLAHFVEARQLQANELQELKELLEKSASARKGRKK